MREETLQRTRRPQINTNELEQTNEQTIDLASTIENPEMAIVTDESLDSPHLKEYLSEMKFMEDKVEFIVSESEDPNAPNPVSCGVNGEIKHFKRGEPYTAPRKFLNALINTVFRVETRAYKDEQGLDQTEIKKIPMSGLNISILHDPAGETGPRWLQYKMKSAY